MILAVLAVVGGIVTLAVAADQFVIGAARVALLRDIPAIVVGVIIIGFGTSAPEMLVSLLAALRDEPELAYGNIVGSNLANLSLLLGVGALIVPLVVGSRVVRREAPLTLLAMAAVAVVVQGGGISRPEGAVLAGAMALSLALVARADPTDPIAPETVELAAPGEHRLGVEVLRTGLGLGATIGAAQLLLWGALDLAERADLSGGFVGATLVAVGTSLPELVTVVQSARRRETDLVLGNLLGSNLFNSLGVGAIVGLVGGGGITDPALTVVAAPASVAVGVVAVAAMITGRVVRRPEGAVLVVAYLAIVPLLS